MCPGEPGTAYCYNADTLDGTGACTGRAACWEPLSAGSSFCWGPSLEGPTSPSSSRSSMPGHADRDRREVRRARHPPPCARPSHPARPTHGSRTFPPPCTAHAPPCTPRFHLTPYCPRVRRSSISPFCLGQGRVRRAEAARRRWHGPCGPGARLCALGGSVGGALGVRRRASRAASPAQTNKGWPRWADFCFASR